MNDVMDLKISWRFRRPKAYAMEVDPWVRSEYLALEKVGRQSDAPNPKNYARHSRELGFALHSDC